MAQPAPPAAVICEGCHGSRFEGIRSLGAPRLAGLQPWYLARQLRGFRDGLRGGAGSSEPAIQMRSMAATLDSDATIDLVATYIASLPSVPQEPTSGGDDQRGGGIYALQCASCHGDAGEGIESLQAPRLEGGNDWYIVRQLEDFRSGRRGTDARDQHGATMRGIAAALPGDQALRDVATYIAAKQ